MTDTFDWAPGPQWFVNDQPTHNPLVTHTRFQAVVTCSCGWIGVRAPNLEAALEQYRMHAEQAALYERTQKLEPVPWA